MADLMIQKEAFSPYVSFKEEGELFIEGKSVMEDPGKFYTPLIDRAKNITMKKIDIIIKIGYINTESTKMIFRLLNEVERNSRIKIIKVNWYYEIDDQDMAELGEMIAEKLNKIEFNSTACYEGNTLNDVLSEIQISNIKSWI